MSGFTYFSVISEIKELFITIDFKPCFYIFDEEPENRNKIHHFRPQSAPFDSGRPQYADPNKSVSADKIRPTRNYQVGILAAWSFSADFLPPSS
jgi:hypothetical protein